MNIKNVTSGHLTLIRKGHLPHEVIFFVTNRCNSSCSGCFYRNRINKPIKELSPEEIKNTSAGMGRFYSLLLSGGEPFLREELPEICRIFYRNNRPGLIFIPTNGLMTKKTLEKTEEILQKCKTNIVLAPSLDGTEKVNDDIRGVQGGFRKTIKTTEGLIMLKERYPNLSIMVNTVVSRRNYREIPKLMGLIKTRYDVNYHSVSPIRNMAGRPSEESPTPRQWKTLYKILLRYDIHYFSKEKARFLGLNLKGKRKIYNLIEKGIMGQGFGFRCLAGNTIGVIEPDGNVRLCESTETVGNLRDFNYDFRRLWFSEEARKRRIEIRKCSCIHPCFLVHRIVYNPRIFLSTILK